MFRYLIYDGYKLIGGTDNFQAARQMSIAVTGRLFDSQECKFCTCNKDERDCSIHGISAQLNRSQME